MKIDAIKEAKRVLEIEAEAIVGLIGRLNSEFERAIELVWHCPGKLVVTGLGKSGLVARKIAATFAGTGAPAIFLHPAEAVHGDIGMLTSEDVVIAISKSGETREVLDLFPIFKRLGVKIIAITGAPESSMAQAADASLDASVKEEACPLGLAPTASSTAALALGDALAITIFKKRGLTEQDFAFLHPGGSIGRKLLKVSDLMHKGDELPVVSEDTPMEKTLLEISQKRLGHAGVLDKNGELVGVVTDGDLRRAIAKYGTLAGKTAKDIMTPNPKIISGGALAARALKIMETHSITAIFVKEPEGKLEGIIHLHDVLKARVA